MTIFSELKRRNVVKVASVYLVTCWLILQIISVIAPALQLPAMFSTIVTVGLVIGFPVICIFAWAFELTPEGLKLSNDVDTTASIHEQTDSKINYFLVSGLVLAIVFIGYEKLFVFSIDEDLERSIAVLPFEDMSPNKSQGYFGDGIAEEILNTLARIDKLIVISRTSSFAFKDKNKDIREIGDALGVNYVLEGSVRKDKDKLRITAQLIKVQSGAHIWSQTYDRTLDNVFAVQDELTFAITQALQLNLLPEQIEHERGMTASPEAYELFIQGRELGYQRTFSALEQAVKLLNQAIAIDDTFYLAKAQLYTVYRASDEYGGFTVQLRQSEKERLFWELLKGPDFPLQQLVLGSYARGNNKPDVAAHFFEQAYKNAPNESLIQNVYLSNMSDIELVIAERRKIIKANPESQINYNNLIRTYVYNGRVDEAKQLLSLMNKKFPDSGLLLPLEILMLYNVEQNIGEALTYLDNYTGEPSPRYKLYKVSLNLIAGNINFALNYLSELLSESPEYEGGYLDSLFLLYELNAKGKLTIEQQAKLQALPVSKKFSARQKELLSLLKGNDLPYVKANQLVGLSPEEFSQKINIGDLPFYYAAIKKHQGDSRYAELLLASNAHWVQRCKQTIIRSNWCLLIRYLDGSYTPQQQFDAFKNSIQLLYTSPLGAENFIFTSPLYYGVNQHPEFKNVANEFLNKTFRKWNPDLVPVTQ
jgi:pentatricopeptide repeat protein